jgi:hypothetical protein
MCGASHKPHARPVFFKPNPERDAFGSMHPNALRSGIWRDQNARRL